MATTKGQLELEIKTRIQNLQKQTETLKPSQKDLGDLQAHYNRANRYFDKKDWNLQDLTALKSILGKITSIINRLTLTSKGAAKSFTEFENKLGDFRKTEQEEEGKLFDLLNNASKYKFSVSEQKYKDIVVPKRVLEQTFIDYQKEHMGDEQLVTGSTGRPLKFDTFWNYMKSPSGKEKIQNWDKLTIFDEFDKARQDLEKSINDQYILFMKAKQATEDFKATEPQEGDPKVTLNNEELNKTLKSLDNYGFVLRTTKDDGDNLANSVSSLNIKINKNQTQLTKAFKSFTIYTVIIRSFKKAIREAVTTVKELDKSLTEQAMVTGLSRKQTYGLMKDYQNLAKEVGATTKEVAGVATEYMKQGKTIQDSLTLTEAAVSAAKVARVSVGDSVNYLTTALNGFRLSADDAMKVSDKFAAVAASSATDYDELAIALSKVASQANLAGMSIDYTTALLTKGLETTREAPETMGTALKTIIARMRELSDYGKTLQDGTDINNVESQLAYVDIELRNTNGELRSTQEVLDELGRKWDTLNTNQQAAVAKALAGTRQQSRLIAMMDNYERVIELQQIAERSAGATLAQASTYLEGIEASINKVSVAWESIITNLTNSEFIIGIIDKVANFLDFLSTVTEWLPTQIVLFGALGWAISGIIAKKIIENQLQREQITLQEKLTKERLLKQQEELADQILAKSNLQLEGKVIRLLIQKAKVLDEIRKAKQGEKVDDLKLKLAETEADETAIDNAIAAANAQKLLQEEIASGSDLGKELKAVNDQLNAIDTKHNKTLFNGVRTLAFHNLVEQIHIAWTQKSTKTTKDNTKAVVANNAARFWMITAAVLAVAAIGTFIYALTNHDNAVERSTKRVKEYSTQLYKINESAQKLNEVVRKFDSLDSQIIKTNKDLKEMNSLLKGVEDTIDFTKGGTVSKKKAEAEKDSFKILGDKAKINYIKTYNEEMKEITKQKRKDILKEFDNKTQTQLQEMFEESSNVAAIYGTNNVTLYDQLDQLHLTEKELIAAEQIGRRALENLDIQTAYEWTKGQQIENFTQHLSQLGSITTKSNKLISVLEILNSDNYNIIDQVKAYTLSSRKLGEEEQKIFAATFSSLDTLSKWDQDSLTIIDEFKFSVDEINNFGKALQDLGIPIDDISKKFQAFIINLKRFNGNVSQTIQQTFSSELSGLSPEKQKHFYNQILKSYGDAVGIGMINMGQDLEKITSTVNNFYKTATQWQDLSEDKKTDFISDNLEIFQNNSNLWEAFENGNFEAIGKALENSEQFQTKIENKIAEIDREIAIEEARIGEERNDAYIKYLNEWKDKLKNTTDIFKADLEVLIQQEDKQLQIYKDYLKDQQKLLEDSLNQRKDAYSKYFEDIKQQEEDQDFLDKSNLLKENIIKLSTSTDVTSKNQRTELINELERLEQERTKKLRERAQEQTIENIDNKLEAIGRKFDELLNDERQIKQFLNSESKQPDFLRNIMNNVLNNRHLTALQGTQYFKDVLSAFGSLNLNPLEINKIQESIYNSNTTINMGDYSIDVKDPEDINTFRNALNNILGKDGYR